MHEVRKDATGTDSGRRYTGKLKYMVYEGPIYSFHVYVRHGRGRSTGHSPEVPDGLSRVWNLPKTRSALPEGVWEVGPGVVGEVGSRREREGVVGRDSPRSRREDEGRHGPYKGEVPEVPVDVLSRFRDG